MIQAGILMEGDPVELLEGWLVRRICKNPPHIFVTQTLRDLLPRVVPTGWFVNDQEPVTTDESEPEPDISVVRGEPRNYRTRRPGPGDSALLIEVSDTSLRQDRTLKKRIYARASVPVYWIVNVIDRWVEVYTDPTGPADDPGYRQRKDHGPDEEMPIILDGREVGRLVVRDLLP
jgi:Uma2 family endonuclease